MSQKIPYKTDRDISSSLSQDIAIVLTPEIQEFGMLTICALRYCFGRASYMPSLIVDATKTNWHLLSQQHKVIILKDLAEQIQVGYMGMDCDKQMWLAFYDWILEKNNEENT